MCSRGSCFSKHCQQLNLWMHPDKDDKWVSDLVKIQGATNHTPNLRLFPPPSHTHTHTVFYQFQCHSPHFTTIVKSVLTTKFTKKKKIIIPSCWFLSSFLRTNMSLVTDEFQLSIYNATVPAGLWMFIKALCAQDDKQSYSKCHPWHPYGTRNNMKKHVRFSSNTFFRWWILS